MSSRTLPILLAFAALGSLALGCSSKPPATNNGGSGGVVIIPGAGSGGDGGGGSGGDGSGGSSGSGGSGGVVLPQPVVNAVTPRRGSTVGGDSVTISGLHFIPGQLQTVQIAGNNAVSVNVIDTDTILALTPPGNAGDADVTVQNEAGTGTCTGCFHYQAPVRLDSVDPAEGFLYGGTDVTITGTGLSDSMVVLFGSRRASNVRAVTGGLLVTTPPGDAEGAVDVQAFDADGRATMRRAFTYRDRLSLSYVDPPGGPLAGGNHAVLHGRGLGGATAVLVGGKSATALPRPDGGLDITLPPGDAPGAVDVEVRTASDDLVQHGAYAYFDPAERAVHLYAVAPWRGPLAGGNDVTLVGTGLDSGLLVVKLGASQATVTATSANLVTVTAPAGAAAGPVDVSVRVSAGGATLPAAYRYFVPIVVSAVTPGSGPEAGGTAVTIDGRGFPAGAVAHVGTSALSSPQLVSGTRITGMTGPGTDGPVPVRVEDPADPDNVGVLAAGFEYQGAFSLLNIDPVTGSQSGGTAVTLMGTGFRPGLMSSFGITASTRVTVDNPFTAVAITPRGSIGTVDVTASTLALDSGTLTGAFTYFDPKSSVGGSSGGPLRGTLNVTVLDGGRARFGLPVVGALVVVGTVDTASLTGHTDDRGQITFSDPTLVKPQVVSVAFPAYEQVTVVNQATENLTVFLRPNSEPTQCFDGIDNDGDGTIDMNGGPNGEPKDVSCQCDPSQSPLPDKCMCPSPLAPPVEYNTCCDGLDNDGDGLIDADDPDCACSMGFAEALPQCSDCIDNDGDGLIDAPQVSMNPDPACTSPSDDSERGGIVSGRVFGFKLPPSYKLKDGDEEVARVTFTEGSIYFAPPFGALNPEITVAKDGGTYSFEIPGKQHMAMYAYYGVRNGNTFVPMLLGIHRNINSDPAHPITDADIVLNVALDQKVDVNLLNSPSLTGSTTDIFSFIDLGQDGVIPLKQDARTAVGVDMSGTKATLKYMPRLQGDYLVVEGLGLDPNNFVPFSIALRRQPGDVRAGITLGPMMDVPHIVTPADDGSGNRVFNGIIEWTLGNGTGPTPAVTTIEIDEQTISGPVPQWNFVVPGDSHRVVAPASVLAALKQKYPQGSSALTITLQTGNEPRFAFDQWNYNNLSLTNFTEFSEDEVGINLLP